MHDERDDSTTTPTRRRGALLRRVGIGTAAAAVLVLGGFGIATANAATTSPAQGTPTGAPTGADHAGPGRRRHRDGARTARGRARDGARLHGAPGRRCARDRPRPAEGRRREGADPAEGGCEAHGADPAGGRRDGEGHGTPPRQLPTRPRPLRRPPVPDHRAGERAPSAIPIARGAPPGLVVPSVSGTLERLDRRHETGPSRRSPRQHREQRAEDERIRRAVRRACPREQGVDAAVGDDGLTEPQPHQVTERVDAGCGRARQDRSGVPVDGLEARPASERGQHAVDVGPDSDHPVRPRRHRHARRVLREDPAEPAPPRRAG
ncbi:hypothetical protein Q9Q99_03825 [Curtobacterium flaccumfaciens]|nr:hypothetical protein Q9Q99_03825 [Curtobacterium flaccumfaciens]